MAKLNESASAGATSAGAIATTATGLNFPMQRRLPTTTIFQMAENSREARTTKKDKKKI